MLSLLREVGRGRGDLYPPAAYRRRANEVIRLRLWQLRLFARAPASVIGGEREREFKRENFERATKGKTDNAHPHRVS